MTINSVNSLSGAGGQTAATATKTTLPGQIDKNMFLQLLVAQLKNQDPMNPTDSTAFVGQLAQFQQLEQSINSGQDLAAIRQDLDLLVSAPASQQSSAAAPHS